MGRAKNISFTASEQAAVWFAAELITDPVTARNLRSLHAKMVEAREVKPAKDAWQFNVVRAMSIAKEMLSGRIQFAPQMPAPWYLNKNRFIAQYKIDEVAFRRACEIVKSKWFGDIYFDRLLSNVNELVATNKPAQPKPVFKGFAEVIEVDPDVGWQID